MVGGTAWLQRRREGWPTLASSALIGVALAVGLAAAWRRSGTPASAVRAVDPPLDRVLEASEGSCPASDAPACTRRERLRDPRHPSRKRAVVFVGPTGLFGLHAHVHEHLRDAVGIVGSTVTCRSTRTAPAAPRARTPCTPRTPSTDAAARATVSRSTRGAPVVTRVRPLGMGRPRGTRRAARRAGGGRWRGGCRRPGADRRGRTSRTPSRCRRSGVSVCPIRARRVTRRRGRVLHGEGTALGSRVIAVRVIRGPSSGAPARASGRRRPRSVR
jgi:hypothetical protein